MARPVTVEWGGGMKAQATIGPHRVVFDASPDVGGADIGPSPGELLLGAVGA